MVGRVIMEWEIPEVVEINSDEGDEVRGNAVGCGVGSVVVARPCVDGAGAGWCTVGADPWF